MKTLMSPNLITIPGIASGHCCYFPCQSYNHTVAYLSILLLPVVCPAKNCWAKNVSAEYTGNNHLENIKNRTANATNQDPA